ARARSLPELAHLRDDECRSLTSMLEYAKAILDADLALLREAEDSPHPMRNLVEQLRHLQDTVHELRATRIPPLPPRETSGADDDLLRAVTAEWDTVKEIAKRAGLTQKYAERRLKRLADEGRIERRVQGKGKRVYYRHSPTPTGAHTGARGLARV